MRPLQVGNRLLKVKFWHERYDLEGQVVYSKSGRRLRATTFGQILDLHANVNGMPNNPLELASAEAQCAWEDNFEKSYGRQLCLRRMLDGQWEREIRKMIWKAYWREAGYVS